MRSWRAGCSGTGTSGSEGGGEETTARKRGTGVSPPTLYPAIAGRLGISEQAARARVSRGLRALATALDRHASGAEGTA